MMTRAANPWRGEVPVILGGVEYIARPDYTAVLSWEKQTGRTSTELLVRFGGGAFGVGELVAVLHAAIMAGGARMPIEDLGRMVVEEGQVTLLPAVGRLLHNALTGGKEPTGEAAAPEVGVPHSGA
jgi:Phage tail tube protein, GTA-gp10